MSEQADRAKNRAAVRAQSKAERAAASGITLPVRKRKRGWQILQERLNQGTLLPSLKRMSNATVGRRRSSFKRVSNLMDGGLPGLKKTFGIGKMDTKMILLQAKAAHEQTKRKRLEREERRKLIKKQKKLERELEYLNFPSMLGWYYDGFFTPYFQLNEEYASIFNQMEVEISKAKEKSITETFAELAKRYFWPPDILGGFCFRTRGIYLDFREIIKDPPHTPPEVVLDQRMEAVTMFVRIEGLEIDSKVPSDEFISPMDTTTEAMGVAEFNIEEERTQRLIKEIEDNPDLTEEEKSIKKRTLLFALKKKQQKSRFYLQVAEDMRFKAINKHDYYFNDQIPGFFKKKSKDRDKYYYDSTWDVWRIKREIIYFPNDFYWDEQLAVFFPKDRTRPPDYYIYDHNIAAYRVAGDNTPLNWRGVRPSNFFFDYRIGKWVKKSSAPAGVSPFLDQNGQRYCVNKTHDIPDDFYFDITTQQFEKKLPDSGKMYFYDPDFGAWRQVNTPLPRKNLPKPIDFYWNEVENIFKVKDAPASFFAWDQNSNFFRKKKSLHGKYHPKNWSWMEKNKAWQLKKAASHHALISDSVYWRPDRDYDKPWLEYVGGFRDFHIEYDYERMFDGDDGKSTVTEKTAKTNVGADTNSAKQLQLADANDAKGSASGSKKLQFSSSAPNLKGQDDKTKTQAIYGFKDSFKTGETGKTGILKQDEGKPPSPSQSEQLMFVDTLDRKTLKVTNVGGVVDDVDLRKYFASVKKVVRPRVPGSDLGEDYAYLKFKTDEGAAAALKTMHGQVIKGQELKLAYKAKNEDETIGGQRDNVPPPPPIPLKKKETDPFI